MKIFCEYPCIYHSGLVSTTVIRPSLLLATILFIIFNPCPQADAASTEYEDHLTLTDFARARSNNLREDDTSFLNAEDFEAALKLTQSDLIPKSGKKRLDSQKYVSGDIAGSAVWKKKGLQNLRDGLRRNGVRLTYDKWPRGRIPYALSNRYNQRERAILASSILAYHTKTCIRFVPRKAGVDKDYLYIGKIDGCFSDVGRAGGRQEVSLDDGCIEYDTAIHELMHAVGFWHEHERWDRDDFIQIQWQNIDREAYDQFGRVNLFESSYYGEPYDYYSIMHYDRKSFSKNGMDTMSSKNGESMSRVIGKVKDFSAVDLRKISKMYSCSSASNQKGSTLNVIPEEKITSPNTNWSSWQGVSGGNKPQQPVSTSNGVCTDKATLCWKWQARCNSPFFEQIMRQFCAKTCGFCRAPVDNTLPLQRHFTRRG